MDSNTLGIIGTLAGTVLGAVLAIIPQHLGRLRINISECVLQPIKAFDLCSIEICSEVTSWEKAEMAALEFTLNLHNSKAFPLSYRDVYIEIRSSSGEILTEVLKNIGCQDKSNNDDKGIFRVMNIPSHVMLQYDCGVYISVGLLDASIKDIKKVKLFLCMRSFNGRKKRVLIPCHVHPGIEK